MKLENLRMIVLIVTTGFHYEVMDIDVKYVRCANWGVPALGKCEVQERKVHSLSCGVWSYSRWVNLLRGVEFYEGSGIWQSCDKRFLLSWEVSVLCLFVRVSWLSRELCLIIFSPRVNAGRESLSGFSLPADQKWWPGLPRDLAKRGGGATGAFIFQYKKKKINLDNLMPHIMVRYIW